MTALGPSAELFDSRQTSGWGGRFYGVYTALVTDIVDPDSQARVRVRLPWTPDPAGTGNASTEVWARLTTQMAGAGRGCYFVPEVDDEVLVAFEAGDPRRAYVVGALWNGQDAPPEEMDSAGRNEKRVVRSRNGVVLTFEDVDGAEKLTLETPAGQKVELRDGPGEIELSDESGNVVKLSSEGVSITASAKVTVDASSVEINAGQVSVNAGMSKFSGVVKADTVITNSVVSSSYTPGAGNVW